MTVFCLNPFDNWSGDKKQQQHKYYLSSSLKQMFDGWENVPKADKAGKQ